MRYWESRKKPERKKKAAPKTAVASGGNLRNYPFLRTFYQHQAVISGGIQKLIFFVVVASLLYAFVFGDSGAIRLVALNHEKAQLDEEVAGLQYDIERLQSEIDRLKSDPFIMEKLGRERYGFVQPGDRVYKIVRPKQAK